MLKKIALAVVALYQACVRAVLPSCCRFYPSCSEYAKQAIDKHGFYKGGLKAIKRVLACHPFSGRSGYDPIG